VVLTNPDNTLLTDSLRYNSETEDMSFRGFTQIFSDTNYIACTRGFYNSRDRRSYFSDDVYMQARQQKLNADSLLYDQAGEFTEAFRNIVLRDTVENMVIQGEHLFYNEAKNRFRITENVLYIMTGDKDSLFLHADTLVSLREEETRSRRIQAYPHVQFYREDIQGQCDSLDYLVIDSLIQLFREPVIWMDNNQLTSDTLAIFLTGKGIGKMEMQSDAFMITKEDSLKYDQIKGKKIIGYFRDDKLHDVEVTGNGESLFYPKDGEEFIGQYKALSSIIRIFFADGKFDRISFITDPDSKLTPIKDLAPSDLYLEGFSWKEGKRPVSREDIMVWK
jgi:lipopolysaccharide export system protein LptA